LCIEFELLKGDSDMNFFPWPRGTTLTEAVKAGLPVPNTQPAKVKRAPTTEAALAARAKNCKRIAARIKRQLNGAERDRYAGTVAHVLKYSNFRGHSSRVFRSLLGWELGTEMAERLGLPSHRERREALERSAKEWEIFNATASKNDEAPAKPAAPAVKDWRARANPYGQLVKDDQPGDNSMVATAEMIINAARKARGDVPESKQIDPGRALKRGEGWHRR
jgi:hypothetical protein